MGIDKLEQLRSTMPASTTSALRFIQDRPQTVCIISKRMALRLVPYLMPTSDANLTISGGKRHVRFLRLAILGALPTETLDHQSIAAINRTLRKADRLARHKTTASGGVNPSWLGEQCILAMCMQSIEAAVEPEQHANTHHVLSHAYQIESAYNLAPSDVSEGHGELFSTLLENLGRDVNAGSKHQDVFSLVLFEHRQLNFDTNELWESFQSFALAAPQWNFWRHWYQGFLDGNPLDWELQRRVALIDDAIWEAGPEAVAQEIARIERLFELEHEIAALKTTLPPRSVLSSTSLIGDNGGPPLDDGVQKALRGDFVLIWEQIEELEAEIAKPEPSPGKLKKIAKALWDISVRIASYCGGKIDLSLTEASKEAGKAVVKLGAPIAVASLAAQNEGIQQVAKAIWAFVKTLPPG